MLKRRLLSLMNYEAMKIESKEKVLESEIEEKLIFKPEQYAWRERLKKKVEEFTEKFEGIVKEAN